MTATADHIALAVQHIADGHPDAAMSVLDKHFPTAQDSFVVAWALATAIASVADGDGPVTVEMEELPGAPQANASIREGTGLAAALIGAAGNGHLEAGADAYFGTSDPMVVGHALADLLGMLAAIVRGQTEVTS